MTWRRSYALWLLVIFFVELAIATWARDAFVRPFVGDVLAVIGVYCGLRAALRFSVPQAVGLAFAIGCLVEALQALGLAGRLGLRRGSWASIALGTTFDAMDLVAYACGVLLALAVEFTWRRRGRARSTARAPRQLVSHPTRGAAGDAVCHRATR